jgi:hypothetical protein
VNPQEVLHLRLRTGLQLAYDFQNPRIEVNVVVNHLPLAAFSTVNVRYPKLCLKLVFAHQTIHMLKAYLVSKILADANALITQFNLPVRGDLGKFLPRSADLLPAGCYCITSAA